MAKAKNTNMEVKRKNRNRIYRYVRKCKVVSNPDIAYELKLSLPTVTQNTKELIEMGLITERGELESTGEERQRPCQLRRIPGLQSALTLPGITLDYC